MLTKITGDNGVISKQEVDFILKFFANELLGSRLANNIFVEVYQGVFPYAGLTGPTDFGYRNHREFDMFIDTRMGRRAQIRTMAHEMEHIRQWARNEFKHIQMNVWKWKGDYYTESRENYRALPWEIAARAVETPLYHAYKQYLKESGKTFN